MQLAQLTLAPDQTIHQFSTTIIKTTSPETTSFSAQLRNERDYNASNVIREVQPKAAKAYCTRIGI